MPKNIKFEIDDYEKLAGFTGGLNSTIRLKIIELLAQDSPKKFSEIAREIEIIPSTLQNHLQKLLEEGIISKTNNQYYGTFYAQNLLSYFRKLVHDINHKAYFSYHYFPFLNYDLFKELFTLDYEIITNFITLFEKGKAIMNESDSGKLIIGGQFNMDLEKEMLKYFDRDFSDFYFEIIIPGGLLHELQAFFMMKIIKSKYDIEKFQIYLANKCEVSFFIFGEVAMLILPHPGGKVDFTSALLFNNARGVEFVKKIAEYYKTNSRLYKHK